MKYQVIVGNIGTVFDGDDLKNAKSTFKVYVEQSKSEFGRASGEDVCMMSDGEIVKEHQARPTPPVLPTIKDLSALIVELKKQIGDEYRAYDDCDEDDVTPSMLLTIGADGKGRDSWGWQTGDNSYTGGAYGYANWAVTALDRRCNSKEVARGLIEQLENLIYE